MKAAPLLPLLLLSACGSGATDPSGATPSEARQLNEAAAMLDANSVSPEAVNQAEPR
ncbi:MAG: hypothetical protein K2X76_04615 [Sphingomonas sp.]|nr:hypothetical protein [Sphingomonas sp.]